MNFKLDKTQKKWIEDTFAKLTLSQKIGQMVCEKDKFLQKQEDLIAFLKDYPVGSVFVGAEIIDVNADHTENVKKNVSKIRKTSEIPMLFAGDFEHGAGSEVSGLTHMPDLMGLGATFNPDLSREYGKIIAEESLSLDVRWVFCPVVDLNTNMNNPVTNVRAITDSPDIAVDLLVPHIEGMQNNGIAAAAKHFPGDGTDSRNQHYVTSVNTLSMDEWEKRHGLVFQTMINAGVYSIMIGHIAFPAYEELDKETNRYIPATASKKIMTNLLRDKMGFEGVIVTDALIMCGYCSWDVYEKRIIASINGGADIFLWPDTSKFFKVVNKALEEKNISMTQIDKAVKRILTMKALVGLHKDSIKIEQIDKKLLDKNYQTALLVAEQGITLLRNRTNTLPLKLRGNDEILMLISPDHKNVTEILSVFKSEFSRRGYKVTFDSFVNYKLYKEKIEDFDAVLLLSDAKPLYGDFRSVPSSIWQFMSNHNIKNKIIISFGTPYLLYETASADTYINVYSDCKASQKTAAKMILGELPFRGHSPVSCPYTFYIGDGTISKESKNY